MLQNHKFNTLYAEHINIENLFRTLSESNYFNYSLTRLCFFWMPAIKGLIKILQEFKNSFVVRWFQEMICCNEIWISCRLWCAEPNNFVAFTNLSAFCEVKHSLLCCNSQKIWPEEIISLLMPFLCNSLPLICKGLMQQYLCLFFHNPWLSALNFLSRWISRGFSKFLIKLVTKLNQPDRY